MNNKNYMSTCNNATHAVGERHSNNSNSRETVGNSSSKNEPTISQRKEEKTHLCVPKELCHGHTEEETLRGQDELDPMNGKKAWIVAMALMIASIFSYDDDYMVLSRQLLTLLTLFTNTF